MTTTIKYSESRELWKLQDELKANGYRKTSDCYWIQTFIDDKGNLIALEREEETALKSLWKLRRNTRKGVGGKTP